MRSRTNPYNQFSGTGSWRSKKSIVFHNGPTKLNPFPPALRMHKMVNKMITVGHNYDLSKLQNGAEGGVTTQMLSIHFFHVLDTVSEVSFYRAYRFSENLHERP